MSTQIILIGLTFVVFGIIASIAQQFTVAYLGLMLIGLAAVVIGLVTRSK